MRRIATGSVAAMLAAAGIATGTSDVLAECPPGPDDHRLDVGYAFIAKVDEASRDVGPPVDGNAPFDWHVELNVERVYRGDLPDRFAFDGWDAGCSPLRGDQLQAGDRVFILAEDFELAPPRDPLSGDFLMWRDDGADWSYDAEAIGARVDETWLTARMRTLTRTSEIVRLALTPPDTATRPSTGAPLWAPVFVALIAIGVAASRFSRDGRASGRK